MALVLRNIFLYYDYIFNECTDPRVAQYPLVGSPLPIIGIITLYLFFVNKWGPKFMEHRKPYDLQNVMIVFNLTQILANVYIVIIGYSTSYGRDDFDLYCQPLNRTDNYPMRQLTFVTYLYYVLKIVDLLDTVFFVLRKKYNQITFLHLYHHAGMAFGTYIGSKFLSGSHVTMLGLINAIVHVLMYTYYFLTAFKPELKQSLWWKKHITQVQLLQFFILICHFGVPLVLGSCSVPKFVLFCGFIQNIFMFVLFLDFYVRAYRPKKGTQKIQ